MSESSVRPNILLLGTHGQKNWGDELLLLTFLHQLAPAAGHFFINSYDPPATAELTAAYPATTFHTKHQPWGLFEALLKSRTVIFAGGSIIKELYPEYGGRRHRTLKMLDTMSRAVRLLPGRTMVFSNIGVGPLTTPKAKQLARRILARGSQVAVRDTVSYELTQNLALPVVPQLVPDAVFSLRPDYFQLYAEPAGAPKVVINLCKNIAPPGSLSRLIDHLTISLTQLLAAYPNLEIVGVPMQSRVASNDDLEALKTLRYRVLAEVSAADFVLLEPSSIDEVAQALSTAQLVIAERLHTLILATILHIPFVALEYDVKVSGVVADLGLADWGVNIREPYEAAGITRVALAHLRNQGSAKERVVAAAAAKHTAANDYFRQLRHTITTESAGP